MEKEGKIGSVGSYDLAVQNGAASAEADATLLGGLLVLKISAAVPEAAAIDALFALAESKVKSTVAVEVMEDVKGWLKSALGLSKAAAVAAPEVTAEPAAAPAAPAS